MDKRPFVGTAAAAAECQAVRSAYRTTFDRGVARPDAPRESAPIDRAYEGGRHPEPGQPKPARDSDITVVLRHAEELDDYARQVEHFAMARLAPVLRSSELEAAGPLPRLTPDSAPVAFELSMQLASIEGALSRITDVLDRCELFSESRQELPAAPMSRR